MLPQCARNFNGTIFLCGFRQTISVPCPSQLNGYGLDSRPVRIKMLGWLGLFFGISASAVLGEQLPTVAPGFKVELLHTVPAGGGSWVCMTSDAKGRLVISPEGPGGYLTQVSLSAEGKVIGTKKIDRPVGSAMGLAFAFGSLYIDGDGIKGFGVYRLPYDLQADEYGSPILIAQFRGYPPHEHGAHGIAVGRDGRLYVVGGDLVQPRLSLLAPSPLTNFAMDQVIPAENDPNGLGVGAELPEGFVMRMGPNGENTELFCGGLRNMYAIAFNAEGELFGFDNDDEADWGLPWYRPNALYHLVSGADYGYREGSAKWGHDFPDSWPEVSDGFEVWESEQFSGEV
jgi:hypothetical protein